MLAPNGSDPLKNKNSSPDVTRFRIRLPLPQDGKPPFPTVHAFEFELMPPRKRLEGALADWHPHPKDASPPPSLAPMVRDAAPVDEVAERFFADAPDVRTPPPPPAANTDKVRDAAEPLAIRERRRYLMRYVASAVAVAALIVVAAAVRVTTERGAFAASRAVPTSANALSIPALTGNAAGEGPAAAAPEVPAATPVATDTSAAAPETAAAAPEAPSAASPSTDSADDAPSESSKADIRSAREAKREALRALEHIHLAAAIDAGERSVALDPTDADAWLILGAAYQRRGKYREARRCFTTCAHQAKRGDRFECSALLR